MYRNSSKYKKFADQGQRAIISKWEVGERGVLEGGTIHGTTDGGQLKSCEKPPTKRSSKYCISGDGKSGGSRNKFKGGGGGIWE